MTPVRFSRHTPAAERFAARVVPGESGCLEWGGCRDRDGYGLFHDDSRQHRAHRYAYARERGEIPPGLVVCHTCDNPSCVNVDHLFLGTVADNNHDRDRKGRGWGGPRKASPAAVEQMRAWVTYGFTRVTIARWFGMSQSRVSLLTRGVRREGFRRA